MSTLQVTRLDSGASGFDAALDALTRWSAVADPALEQQVGSIIADVRQRGDTALLEYTARFDHFETSVSGLSLFAADVQASIERVDGDVIDALRLAASRIRAFHERQKAESWQFTDASGTLLGQQVTPLDTVGIYVPGGKAAYPSSVLMNAIPAVVAGVREIIMVVPSPRGVLNDVVLAAAAIAGISRVVTIGGAQAIAALAYGTESVPRVDKIVGPGNRYVACAKKMVFGDVGLDMVAGPSEILIISDAASDPDWIAMDLFSQAEHDEQAQSILLSPDSAFLDAVEASMNRLLPELERRDIIRQSIEGRSALIKVESIDAAVELANRIAPEHLELAVDEPASWLPKIRNAGAIFLGRYTPEAMGDYCAGPNHVLPTSTTARFASPLGVYDFQKRSSVIQCSESSASTLGAIAARLAESESLTAHARSAAMRIDDKSRLSESAERDDQAGGATFDKSSSPPEARS